MATSKTSRHPVHHGEPPHFDYMPKQRADNCIKVRMALKKGQWPLTFHVPGVWVKDLDNGTLQWVDAKVVKWLIEIPGCVESPGPLIITEEYRRRNDFTGKLPEVTGRDGLLLTSGFMTGVAVTFFVLIGSTLFNNAAALVTAAL